MGKGGIIGKANDPTSGVASGIWNLREHLNAVKSSLWPGNMLFSFTTYTFTNAGANGIAGPTLAQCQTAYTGTSWISSYFNVVTQGIQQWTVPATGTYQIKVAGAQGGAGKFTSYYGGFGAIMQGDVPLTQGDVLYMVVGQKGGYNPNGSAGGGGGSFVMRNATSSLLIAAGGGGGGGGNSSPANGIAAVTTTSGAAAGPNAGGTNGGGGTGTVNGSGGGGGYSGGGTGGGTSSGNSPGSSIVGAFIPGSGGRGGSCSASQSGSFNWNSLGNDQGGFGGGGGGEWCQQGASGGGGGYSGGAGTTSSSGPGAGGGSYFDGSVTNRYTSNGLYNGSATGISNLGVFNGVTTLTEQAALHGYITITRL
jgi:Glycine rich protein